MGKVIPLTSGLNNVNKVKFANDLGDRAPLKVELEFSGDIASLIRRQIKRGRYNTAEELTRGLLLKEVEREEKACEPLFPIELELLRWAY